MFTAVFHSCMNESTQSAKINLTHKQIQNRRGQDNSITSVNSSGQDSGIAEATRCPCGQSSVHTSEESSGCSYEDSLKSNQDRKSRNDFDQRFIRRASFNQQPFSNRRHSHRRQSFSENVQRHYTPFERIGSGGKVNKRISTSNLNISQSYLNGKKKYLRKEIMNEPTIDYDHSEVDDIFETKLNRRLSAKNLRRSSFMELGGQAAVFVTPAAAELMRRQGGDKLMFARPL